MADPHLSAILTPPSALADPTETLSCFAAWLRARKGLAASTTAGYVGAIRRALPELGPDFAPGAVDHYILTMRDQRSYGLTVTTAVAIERYLDFLGHPAPLGRPRKPKTLVVDSLTEAEIAILLAAQKKPRDRAILCLLAYSGLRNAELCALKVEDVDLAGGVIHVRHGKGERARTACIAGACAELLARYLRERAGAPGEPLFRTERRKLEMEPQDLRKLVRRAAKRAGLARRVHPHLFRHSLAMNMLNRGANIYTIKEQLGHQHIETTMLYLRSTYTRAKQEYHLCAPCYL